MDAEPPRTDIADHQRTFDAFIRVVKWSIAVTAIILILMAVFLV